MRYRHLIAAYFFTAGLVVGIVGTHWTWLEHAKSQKTLSVNEVAAVLYCMDDLKITGN